MFCTNCGKELKIGMIVCPYCSVPVSGMVDKRQYGRDIFEKTPKDRKFSFFAFLFDCWWLLFKGLWDAAIITLLVSYVLGLVVGILVPGIGTAVSTVIGFVIKAFWGINGRYYVRLKREHGISFLQALKAQKEGTI